jgi:ABC-type polysaccharide/polyol phosphate export permease
MGLYGYFEFQRSKYIIILINYMITLFNIVLNFIKDIWEKRYLIYELTKRDVSQSHTNSLLGFIWTFIHPILTTLVFMLVFGLGFRSRSVHNAEFVPWFLCGLLPWNFFSSCLLANTNIINSYSYLVKKINFRVSIIPIVKILSGLFIHLIFICVLLIVLLFYKVPLTVYWLQYFYYLFALLILLLGSSWAISSVNVFVSDIGQINSIILHLGFFATPIFWSLDGVNPTYRFIFILNPMTYIVNGFRQSFIFQVPFWQNGEQTFYFWAYSLIMLLIGIILFAKLRPHFADVV